MPDWFYWPFRYGYLGVDFFFVLSGFIIYYVNHARVDDPNFGFKYSQSRLIRIYVPYLPVIIAYIVAYLTISRGNEGADNWGWITSLTLLPADGRPALGPAWTLQHELIFYFFALMCFQVRSFMWPAILLVALFAVVGQIETGGLLPLGWIDLEFLFGIFAAWCFVNGKLNKPAVLMSVGLMLMVVHFFFSGPYVRIIFGLGIACWLLPIVRWEAQGRIKIGRTLMLLGNASYAIYLTHYPIVKELPRRVDVSQPYLLAIALMAVCIVIGIAYHKMFEAPAIRVVKGWTDRLHETFRESENRHNDRGAGRGGEKGA